MAFQTVFKRYELKYMLTLEQKERMLEAMSGYMQLDKYGRTTVRNIYLDTDSYRLIRRSIEKPVYKSKPPAELVVLIAVLSNLKVWNCALTPLARGNLMKPV